MNGGKMLSIWEVSMTSNCQMIADGFHKGIFFKIKSKSILLDDEIVEKIAETILQQVKKGEDKPASINDAVSNVVFDERKIRRAITIKKTKKRDGDIKWYVTLT